MELDENFTRKLLSTNRPVTGALSMLAIKENWNQYSTHVTCLHIQEQSQLYYGMAKFAMFIVLDVGHTLQVVFKHLLFK